MGLLRVEGRKIILKKKTVTRIIYHIFVIAFGLAMIYPIVWMFFASFKDTKEIFSSVSNLFPKSFDPHNFINGWKGFGKVTFTTFFANSIFVSLVSTVGAVASSALVAYGLARINFRGRKLWFALMLVTMMLPVQILMIPQFIMFHSLGWVNSFLPVIVPQFFGQPFFIFLMMQFIQGLPKELDESAKIDGCNKYHIFFSIILPLLVPALITSLIFSFVWRWDDFLTALLYLGKPMLYTIPMALRMFSDSSSVSDWGGMMAMSTLSLIPDLIIFVVFQKYLVEGIATTGLKG
jgi:multiple sugar transport system permease protein